MNALHTSAFLFLTLTGLAAGAADVYFGGEGDTNTHWVGYQISVATNSFTWMAYTLDPAKRGRIRIAPATFTSAGNNRWTAIFDEYFRRGNSEGYGLAHHELQISISQDRQSIRVRDGKTVLDLLKMSPEDLRKVKSGRIPNQTVQRTGASHSDQETSRTSSAAGSRR